MALRHLTVLALAGTFLLIGAPRVTAEDVLRAGGTGTALGAMRQLAVAFEKASPGHHLEVIPSIGSRGGVKAVAEGALDVALSGRPLGPEDERLGLVAFAYARTPFLFAAGPRVPVDGLNESDATRIYRGEMATWSNGERVRLVIRPRSDVDTDILRSISPEMASAVDAALLREGMLMATTNQECNAKVARTPGAVGPSSLTQLLTEHGPEKALAWNGVAPTLPNLASGAYPLAKTLHVVVRLPLRPDVRRFLSFLGSAEARAILEQTGNLPLPLPRLD